MKSIIKAKSFILIVIVLTSMSFSGCTNLKSVIEFSKLAQKSTASFPAIAADIPDSCKRRQVYENGDCDLQLIAKERVLSLHKIMIGYIEVLGTLADDNLVVADAEFDSLKDSVGNIQGLNENQINAASGLAKYVFKLMAGHYQNKKIREIISENNESFQTIVTLLKIDVGDYKDILADEKAAIKNYYETGIKKNGNETLAIMLAKDTWINKVNAIKPKIDAIKAYTKVLDNISKGHQDLYDGKDDLSSKELLKKIYKQGIEFKKLIGEISKVF